jgi:hypothetical protein
MMKIQNTQMNLSTLITQIIKEKFEISSLKLNYHLNMF